MSETSNELPHVPLSELNERQLTLANRLIEQLNDSWNGSQRVVDAINQGRSEEYVPREQLPRTSREEASGMLNAKLLQWAKSGVLDYVIDRKETYGESYTLVATPNVLVNTTDLNYVQESLAWLIKVPQSSGIYTEIFEEVEELTEEQISGAVQGSSAVRFSLVCNSFSPEIGTEGFAGQRKRLEQLQTANTALNIHTPSVLEAETFWSTLLAADGGRVVSYEDMTDRTYVRDLNVVSVPTEGGEVEAMYAYIKYDTPSVGMEKQLKDKDVRLAVG